MKREDQAEAGDFQKCKSDNFEDSIDQIEADEQQGDSKNKNEEDEDEDDEDLDEEEGAEPENDGEIGGTAKEKSPSKEKKIKLIEKSGGKVVPGILYLGHIPPRLRPKHLRNLLSVYGEIGRIFLQPEDGTVRKKKKKSGLNRCDFTEGWVEFRDKRVAKRVAASLHNTPMGTRKRQRFASDLWCIKYLHRFQWTHLSERLAFEQTVLQQRLRTEVSQAKKETNFYLNNVDKGEKMERQRKKRHRDGQKEEERTWDFTQRQTEEEIQNRKKKKDSFSQKQMDKSHLIQQKSQSNVSLLAKIFNAKQTQSE